MPMAATSSRLAVSVTSPTGSPSQRRQMRHRQAFSDSIQEYIWRLTQIRRLFKSQSYAVVTSIRQLRAIIRFPIQFCPASRPVLSVFFREKLPRRFSFPVSTLRLIRSAFLTTQEMQLSLVV